MSRHLPIVALLCAGTCAAQSGDGQVVERKPIELPSFESSRAIARFATPAEYAEAAADKQYRYERLVYRSNGALVSGFLYAPQSQAGKLPAIVYSRGSLVVNNQAPVLLTMLRRLARAGFVVFAPMFRGSDGMAGRDEMGGADLDDLRNAIEVVKAMPGVDADQVFLYGDSRGGMMTYFALRENWPVRAAAVVGAITDLAAYLKTADPELKLAKAVWPAYESEKDVIHASRSALRWPEKILKPVLILQGGADGDVSPLHALKLAERMTELNRPYSLVIFAGDNHSLMRNRNEADRLAAEWFLKYR